MEIITRKEALLKGLKWYTTGKPCKRGHLESRLTSDRSCKRCSYDKSAASEKTNPNRKGDRHTKQSVLNRRVYYYEYCAFRRALKKRQTPSWANRQSIKDIYKKCYEISKETGILHHVDHLVPLQNPLVCGLHVEWNLQILTAEENIRKNNKFEII